MRFFSSSLLLVATLATIASADQLRGLQAFAGEENKPEDREFAGIEAPLRLAANTIRVKEGVKQVIGSPDLDGASWSLAQDLALKDQDVTDIARDVVITKVKATNFNGTTVKANVFSEPARDGKDIEGATMASMTKWMASKDAFAGLVDKQATTVGSGAAKSASGRAYYVQLYGK